MGKLIKVDKKMLKISVEEFEKKMKEDKINEILLKERKLEFEKNMKKSKEEK